MENEKQQFAFTEPGKETAVTELPRLQKLGETMTYHGRDMALALMFLILGLLLVRWIDKGVRAGMRKLNINPQLIMTIGSVIYIILVALVITTAAVQLGAKPLNMMRLITIITLVVTGVLIFLRPFIPSLPFKVGNTVKAGDLLGKVEAISLLNTRLKTFDGKTFFVPNRQILDDIIINYHYTKTRRVKINMTIRYDQDLLKAKQVLEEIMTQDPRVKAKPGPAIYVLYLSPNGVDIGGRCWVDNKDYWVARCDLHEKVKLRFDQEGIRFAYRQLDLHVNHDAASFNKIGGNDIPDGYKETYDHEPHNELDI